jgi:protocatechuate 3,4-dioxygenase beta subunit
MRVYLPTLTFAALLPWSLFGQGFILPPVASGPTGTVIGHVVCADTRLPARLASVRLMPVLTPPDAVKDHGVDGPKPVTTGRGTGQTQLDGSFTFTGVTPGNYYVIAQLAGYLSPELEFTSSDWSHPTEETVHRMAQVLTSVTVLANNSSQVDVSLIKGGTISGTVHYEDGMPLTNSEVDLLRHDPKGKVNDYYPVVMVAGTIHTDDQGGYRIAGLPEGEYKLYAKLRVNEPPPDPAWFQGRVVSVNDLIAASSQWSELTIYFDHGFRQADGRSVKLRSDEISIGNDIEIRLSKLHSISGTVVDATTGSAVNSATVRMLWIANDPDSSPTQIDVMNVGEDGSFHFALVPEGTYKLTVTRAKSVMHQPALVPPPPNAADGTMQPVQDTAPVDKISREYSDASQPLTVTNDMSSVTVKLSAKPAAAAAQ